MNLTPIQRNFLVTQLGAKPREKSFFQVRNDEEVKADDYLALEQEAFRLQLSLETTLGPALKIVQDFEKRLKEIQDGAKTLEKSNEGPVLKKAKEDLTRVIGQLKNAESAAKTYVAALKTAKTELSKVESVIMPIDKTRIQMDMIDEAIALANVGTFHPAIDLLEKAKEECAAAKTFKEKNAPGDWWGQEFEKLKKHPQKAAFKDEIARLEKQLAIAKKSGMSGLAVMANDLFSSLHWAAIKQLEFADAHGLFVAKRAQIGLLATDLSEGEPKTAIPVVASDATAIQVDLGKADKKAGYRLYEAADTLLEDIRKRCVSAKKIKDLHDEYLKELAIVEPLATGLKTGPGASTQGEIDAITTKLEKAKQAATAKNFAGSKTLLAEVKASCETAKQLKDGYGKDVETKNLAVDGLANATEASAIQISLEKVKEMYEKLKARPGHEALVVELGKIDTALKAAELALALA